MLIQAIYVVFGFAAFAVLMQTIVQIARMRTRSKGEGRLSNGESREFQEVYRGLEAMAKRVEALETLLIDQARRR